MPDISVTKLNSLESKVVFSNSLMSDRKRVTRVFIAGKPYMKKKILALSGKSSCIKSKIT